MGFTSQGPHAEGRGALHEKGRVQGSLLRVQWFRALGV